MSQAPTSVWLHGGSSAGQQSDIPICPSQQRHHDKMQSYREQKPCSRTLLGRFEFLNSKYHESKIRQHSLILPDRPQVIIVMQC